MTTQLSLVFLLALSSVPVQAGKPNFSGRWQFDEAQSTCEQSTKVIKDLPPGLLAKIPYFDVPRFAALARFYNEPPVVSVKHIGARLTFSTPSWFEWFPGNGDLIVAGKEKISSHGGENALTSIVRWDGNSIVEDWKEKIAGVFDSCEGRKIFASSDDGKTLTYDSHTKCIFRASVDGRTYEAEDSQNIHTVLVKKRRP